MMEALLGTRSAAVLPRDDRVVLLNGYVISSLTRRCFFQADKQGSAPPIADLRGLTELDCFHHYVRRP